MSHNRIFETIRGGMNMKNVDYSDMLKKIVYSLYIVIALLVVNSILLTVSIGTKGKTSTSTNNNQQEELPYDVSQFTEMTTDQAMATIQAGGFQVIYIGHSSCGFCRRYVPVLQEAQKAFGYQTIYIDTDKLTSEDSEKWIALDEFVKQSFGYTPLTILTKDGKYVDGQLGYTDYNTLKALLEKNGLQAK